MLKVSHRTNMAWTFVYKRGQSSPRKPVLWGC